VSAETWDWSLLDPDGNNVEALYRDVGNIGHGASPTLR
jgi:hypothetical protein